MNEVKAIRLAKAGAVYNVPTEVIFEALKNAKIPVESNPNFKLTPEMVSILDKEFGSDKVIKVQADSTKAIEKVKKETVAIEEKDMLISPQYRMLDGSKVLGKVEISDNGFINPERRTLEGPKVLGKIDLNKVKVGDDPDVAPRKRKVVKKDPRVSNFLKHWDYDDEFFSTDKFVASGISAKRIRKLVALIEKNRQLVIQGSPGTGKSFISDLLGEYISSNKIENIGFVQFHQSFSYEEFIEGMRINEQGGYVVKDGIFKAFCKKAREHRNEAFVFIIDEINRGNTSRVFGEMLYLLENRDKEITLSYSQDKFAIPSNVYIIGTMNTTDRSIAMMDFAMRRRFAFYTLEPDYEVLANNLSQYDAEFSIDKFIDNIKDLNRRIAANPSLGKSFELGISFFIKNDTLKREDLDDIWYYKIQPLLAEYFYEDVSEVDALEKVYFKGL